MESLPVTVDDRMVRAIECDDVDTFRLLFIKGMEKDRAILKLIVKHTSTNITNYILNAKWESENLPRHIRTSIDVCQLLCDVALATGDEDLAEPIIDLVMERVKELYDIMKQAKTRVRRKREILA
jgi:hypothetical protein